MKRKSILYALALVVLMISCTEMNPTLVPEGSETLKSSEVAKSYVVVLKSEQLATDDYVLRKDIVKGKALGILKKQQITDAEIQSVYGNALQGFSVKMPPGQLKKLEADDAVKYIEEDIAVQMFPKKDKPGNSPSDPAEVTPWGISRVGGGSTASGVAWIVDSGIDLDHPDLNVDVNRSAVFISTRNATPDDQNGHGTHVAGTIAAIDNEIGVVGVAAGATVISVRVLDRRGSGTISGVIGGVDYVAANGSNGDVANMSLGGGISTALDEAVYNASQTGVIFVLAAGNESMDANNSSPARVNGPNVYTISAMDSSDEFAYFSNYGSAVDFCAPGVSIFSTYKDGGYATLSGTSMAAPHVAGLLLLGNVQTDGYVIGDPDGNPDPIAHN